MGRGEVEASVQVHAKQTKAYKAAGQRGSQRLAARRVPRGGGQGATQSKGHANAVIYATLTVLQHSSTVAGSRYALEAFVACNVQRVGRGREETGCCSCCCRKRRVGCAFFGLL